MVRAGIVAISYPQGRVTNNYYYLLTLMIQIDTRGDNLMLDNSSLIAEHGARVIRDELKESFFAGSRRGPSPSPDRQMCKEPPKSVYLGRSFDYLV